MRARMFQRRSFIEAFPSKRGSRFDHGGKSTERFYPVRARMFQSPYVSNPWWVQSGGVSQGPSATSGSKVTDCLGPRRWSSWGVQMNVWVEGGGGLGLKVGFFLSPRTTSGANVVQVRGPTWRSSWRLQRKFWVEGNGLSGCKVLELSGGPEQLLGPRW